MQTNFVKCDLNVSMKFWSAGAMMQRQERLILSLQKVSLMEILSDPISREVLAEYASHTYVDMVKAVADIDNCQLAIDAELHSDLERLLLENGSALESLWGFNLYPQVTGENFIEFDSPINIRPRQGNMSHDVEDSKIRKAIRNIVGKFILQ